MPVKKRFPPVTVSTYLSLFLSLFLPFLPFFLSIICEGIFKNQPNSTAATRARADVVERTRHQGTIVRRMDAFIVRFN